MTPDELDRREELDRRSLWDRFTVGQRVFVVREPGSLLRGEPITGRVISFDRETVAVAETATMTSDDGHTVRFFHQKAVFVTYESWREAAHRPNPRSVP
jgi:RNase P/RNase MRP subunit p29